MAIPKHEVSFKLVSQWHAPAIKNISGDRCSVVESTKWWSWLSAARAAESHSADPEGRSATWPISLGGIRSPWSLAPETPRPYLGRRALGQRDEQPTRTVVAVVLGMHRLEIWFSSCLLHALGMQCNHDLIPVPSTYGVA